MRRFVKFLVFALCLTSLLSLPAAAETSQEEEYCFQDEDFSYHKESGMVGIFITDVPDTEVGSIYLGTRQLRAGDAVAADDLNALTYRGACVEEAQLCYLPVYGDSMEAVETFRIVGAPQENAAPEAQDMSLETYRNISRTAAFQAADPEGGALTFQVVSQPQSGTVEVLEDGTFRYTPQENQVGEDTFTYTATDEAGSVSREATVRITITKPLDDKRYDDMVSTAHEFEAQWLRETGLLEGSQIAGQYRFAPETPVTRGEFLAMMMDLLEIPVDDAVTTCGFVDSGSAEDWMQPYLATALGSGLASGYVTQYGLEFRASQPITGAEAAVLLQNALHLAVSLPTQNSDAPVWARVAVEAMAENSLSLPASEDTLTREDAAVLLYQASNLK